MDKEASKRRELLYLLLVPVGVFLFSVLFDFCNNIYCQNKLDKVTENIFVDALKADSVDDEQEYTTFFDTRYKLEKFEENDIRVTFLHDENDSVMVSNTIEHFSIYGYVTGQKQYTTSRYKGYLDEYNESKVEKLEEIYADDKVEESE